ncbi:glycosyl transferase family 1 [Actinoplanes philippinensis]|uniref:Glycosyltransferase, MSMEG_0565 family n=1 Tax=Actinoplanes philippinensis TaxID=35752 RepID=A0A1I2KJX0_9ACTN|nr:MSMEG_0565 family glycosyltransferase [Actinoplanes philippinensis]GIE82027.1 glycosyl transferase family 1 [Actinoplanes philippinensis]SFF65557.1 glycosyltransferase, MSMEG_0565 family [Actinoplanes philippinensis]
MRIALLTYSTRPRGGVVHTLSLAEALAVLGHDVTVWTLGRGGGFFRDVDPRVRLAVVPFPDIPDEGVGPRILRSIDLLRQAFTPGEYDIVHAQDCISANAVDRCVRTIHHLDRFTTPELAACHEKAIVRPYAHVCVSAAVATEVRDGWGITPTVIPNGVDADRFAAAAPSTEHGRYVLAVGGIEPRKGSIDLLDAYALLRAGLPGLNLVIAGGETLFDYRDYRTAWQTRAAELGVHPRVLGPVDHDALPGLVAGAAAFAFPSTKEGFGLAAMEALAAGVPVVVRDLPVLREVFGSAVGYGSDPHSLARALRDAIGEPSPSRVAAGRALAAAHTWRAAAEQHAAFYSTLMSAVTAG